MSRPVARLATSRRQFDGAHHALARTRSTSQFVRVDRDTLANLLIDHAAMLRTCQEAGRVDYRGDEDQ